MPGTYSQLLYHIVFSTKRREPWLTPDMRDDLFAYIGGIVRAEGGALLCSGGVEDHVHLFIRWKPDRNLSDLMRVLKAKSSRWIRNRFDPAFGWQEGYAAFTVSKSQDAAVKRYLDGQESHHQREDFRTELARLLRAHAVDFQAEHLIG